jgi:hypothetical protein
MIPTQSLYQAPFLSNLLESGNSEGAGLTCVEKQG